MLELDSPKKMQMDKTMSRQKFENNSNSKKYDVEALWYNTVYTKKSKDALQSLYYWLL